MRHGDTGRVERRRRGSEGMNRWWTVVGMGVLGLLAACDRSTPVPKAEGIPSAPSPTAGTTTAAPATTNQEEGRSGAEAFEASLTPNPLSLGEIGSPPVDAGRTSSPAAIDPASPPSDSADELPTKIAVGELVDIEPVVSDDPEEMMRHLQQIDEELRDLVLAGSRNLMERDQFLAAGRQLGMMKLRAGERLANLERATSAQRTAGVVAQLIALSHLSGLGDVEAARKLKQLAARLHDADDPELAHQSRVVLLGFELQALQNGQREDPQSLVELARGLFQRDEDRGFPEFMLLQQMVTVFEQLDYSEAAEQTRGLLVEQYIESPDPQLRGEAWLTSTRSSPELQHFNQLYQQAMVGNESARAGLPAAARALMEAYAVGPTLEHLAKAISQIEYSGYLSLSRQLAELIEQQLNELPESVSTPIVRRLIDAHRRRLAILGQPFRTDGLLVDLEGRPVGEVALGKVTIVDVWATWCVPCLRELPNLRRLYDTYHAQGLNIIGVNVDDSSSDVQAFVSQQQIPWPTYRPADGQGMQSQFAEQYGIKLIPFVLILDAQGNVVRMHVRGKALEETVAELLDPTHATAADEAGGIPDAVDNQGAVSTNSVDP
ncbi:MAG: hypothetical protein KatS3mg111_0675 [Pirellulaceae bacterium]|nr:MAG: hypothetical protein KatS3mg111_0675 [Pirellulaceae bacterium]